VQVSTTLSKRTFLDIFAIWIVRALGADQAMTNEERIRILCRTTLSLACFLLLLAIALFLPAGIGWTYGWVFLVVFLLQTVLAIVYVWQRNPEIFVARSKIQKGTKWWDKVVLLFLLLSLAAIFPVAGLDDHYCWSSASPGVVVIGYVLLSVGMFVSVWVEAVNKFAEPGVRIQAERGHKVIDTGPYAFVRHPMYDASFALFAGMSLALGSYWALIPTVIASLVLIVRTALEDQTLQNELEGYKEYAQRVHYRLIPGVW
jgi:protein-S-isoprenylcysteine O-methyltransferase Ste14